MVCMAYGTEGPPFRPKSTPPHAAKAKGPKPKAGRAALFTTPLDPTNPIQPNPTQGYAHNVPFFVTLAGYLVIFFVEKIAFDTHAFIEEHHHHHPHHGPESEKPPAPAAPPAKLGSNNGGGSGVAAANSGACCLFWGRAGCVGCGCGCGSKPMYATPCEELG
jgi:hypothetical protein